MSRHPTVSGVTRFAILGKNERGNGEHVRSFVFVHDDELRRVIRAMHIAKSIGGRR